MLKGALFMYSNSDLLQAYMCNVISTVISDQSNAPLKIKLAKAAIGSIPKQVAVNTTPFTNMVVNNSTLKQDPPSIQYEDGFALVNQWKDSTINFELPEVVETKLVVGDLIKK
jgi:hypothetical protein